MLKMIKAPLTAAVLARLRADAKDVRATARRKNVTLDDWDEKQETAAAKEHFELGCWLHYYNRRIGLADNDDGLKDRIDCARRLFLAGLNNPGYAFFTIFDFGERQFDTIFEMGDAEQVISGLRELARNDQTGQIARAFAYFGWPLDEAEPKKLRDHAIETLTASV